MEDDVSVEQMKERADTFSALKNFAARDTILSNWRGIGSISHSTDVSGLGIMRPERLFSERLADMQPVSMDSPIIPCPEFGAYFARQTNNPGRIFMII